MIESRVKANKEKKTVSIIDNGDSFWLLIIINFGVVNIGHRERKGKFINGTILSQNLVFGR